MALTIKQKVGAGTGTLFAMLLAISIVAFVFINLLSVRTENLLADNYKTIRYCNDMMYALERMDTDPASIRHFDQALIVQEHNITEQGEAAATRKLRCYFGRLRTGDQYARMKDSISEQLYRIATLNQQALERKNRLALRTASTAKASIAVLSILVVIIGLTLTVNFPGYIADPIRLLTEAIHEIAQKNYHKRIHLDSKDEFGQMVEAFNAMAKQLDEYERSNIARVLFEKKRIETIINQLEDAVFGLDGDRKILFINSAAEGLFHLKTDDIVGKYARDVALHNDLLQTVLQKNTQEPLKIITEGSTRFYIPDFRTVGTDSAPLGEVFTLRDITTFRELDISKTNLLATISHELKTPIASIKMSTRLLNDARIGALNGEQQELLRHITGDAERLLRLTGELLNMTQLETGKIQIKIAPAQAATIAAQAIAAIQMQLQERRIQITTTYGDELPQILADADKTTWVLTNLLTNAIRHSSPDSIVSLIIRRERTEVIFSVTDTGPGIDEEIRANIFERYTKGESTGTGLGLAICKEFIAAQGGWIRVESTSSAGTTFSFALAATDIA